MNTSKIWPNVIAYALQIGLLVGLGALAPTLLRLRTPRARLLYWQALLVACLVLPWVQPWRQEVIGLSNASVLVTVRRPNAVPFAPIVLWLLLAGCIARFLSVGIGLVRLSGYRRRGREMKSDPVFRMASPGSV